MGQAIRLNKLEFWLQNLLSYRYAFFIYYKLNQINGMILVLLIQIMLYNRKYFSSN